MGRQIGLCNLCNQEKPFIKAHVIPKGMFRAMFKERDNVQLVKTGDLEEQNKVQDAFYDTHILCGNCDQTFSPYEQYFASFIRGELNNKIEDSNKGGIGYIDIYSEVDAEKITMFCLITLWRMCISKQPDFKNVSFNILEGWLKEQIISGIVGEQDKVQVMIISLQDIDDVRKFSVTAPKLVYKELTAVLKILINGYVIAYNIGPKQTAFYSAIKPNEDRMQVVRVNEEVGITLLNDITGIKGNFPNSLITEVKSSMK